MPKTFRRRSLAAVNTAEKANLRSPRTALGHATGRRKKELSAVRPPQAEGGEVGRGAGTHCASRRRHA